MSARASRAPPDRDALSRAARRFVATGIEACLTIMHGLGRASVMYVPSAPEREIAPLSPHLPSPLRYGSPINCLDAVARGKLGGAALASSPLRKRVNADCVARGQAPHSRGKRACVIGGDLDASTPLREAANAARAKRGRSPLAKGAAARQCGADLGAAPEASTPLLARANAARATRGR